MWLWSFSVNNLIFGPRKLGLDKEKDTKHCSYILNPFVPTLVAAVSLISIKYYKFRRIASKDIFYES